MCDFFYLILCFTSILLIFSIDLNSHRENWRWHQQWKTCVSLCFWIKFRIHGQLEHMPPPLAWPHGMLICCWESRKLRHGWQTSRLDILFSCFPDVVAGYSKVSNNHSGLGDHYTAARLEKVMYSSIPFNQTPKIQKLHITKFMWLDLSLKIFFYIINRWHQ